ncbi:Toll/interleukin-1 receptor domain-containing protein [Tanacetum coccineum]
MKKLENLRISSYCDDFEIPEIQSVMENLVKLSLFGSSMQEVFLSSVAVHYPNLISLQAKENENFYNTLYLIDSNHLSKLDFNLSKLTMLVHLDLSNCTWIEKLPEFPSSLVTFNADYCDRLTDIGDVNRNCKWLCQVSVIGGGPSNSKGVLTSSSCWEEMYIAASKELLVRGGSMGIDTQDGADWKESNDVDSQDDVDLEESDDVDWEESVYDKRTWVGYVSFGSFRHNATWLDETCKAFSF